MFRAARRSSSGAPSVFAASGLHTHVVTARSQAHSHLTTGGHHIRMYTRGCKYTWSSWWWATCRSKHVELLMNKWNNKFRYQVASCWLFILSHTTMHGSMNINPLNPELNPICYLLALLAYHFLHVSRIRVISLTIRLLMSYIFIHIYIYIYIYGVNILDVSRSHATTHHSR